MTSASRQPHFQARSYDSARKPYADEALIFCQRLIEERTPVVKTVLDIGCGTGISTRQLAHKKRLIVGCDIDFNLIRYALGYETANVVYQLCAAEHLRFNACTFDAVTAFGAFHWFRSRDALMEIKRVLRGGGLILIVNKRDIGTFTDDVRSILKQFSIRLSESSKATYHPVQLLQNHGFTAVTSQEFKSSERFTIPDLLLQIQSMNLWNSVPVTNRAQALRVLRTEFGAVADAGVYKREIATTVVHGRSHQ
jgi:ubiquinone/menaquinone biosynthesis C-methylase UbiE